MSNLFSPQSRGNRPIQPIPTVRPVRKQTRLQKRWTRIVLVTACLLACAGLVWWLIQLRSNTSDQPSDITEKKVVHNTDRTPKFKTILPAGSSIKDFGGWTRVSPDTTDPVFGYKDSLDGTPIIVSEQPLPEGFTENLDDKMAELAQTFSATEKITVDGKTAYIANSSKGPQMLVASKSGLLILIKSTVKHSDNAWAKYLDSLTIT